MYLPSLLSSLRNNISLLTLLLLEFTTCLVGVAHGILKGGFRSIPRNRNSLDIRHWKLDYSSHPSGSDTEIFICIYTVHDF